MANNPQQLLNILCQRHINSGYVSSIPISNVIYLEFKTTNLIISDFNSIFYEKFWNEVLLYISFTCRKF